ncbi:thiamine monophosphate synthase [Methanococcus maripaludis]|uniref:Thiamine monophosphate synthase n=1 Tax=Methanococcus maripaludis TaxID=39152 RepID=A0A7J9P2Z2_METMI|nr:hypothetical protein [Methanococcus maripaludis]MBA2853937.1 thiamine monophosphate synthase [Methanococcus maripaludis]
MAKRRSKKDENPIVTIITIILGIIILGGISHALLPTLQGTGVEWIAVIFARIYEAFLNILN